MHTPVVELQQAPTQKSTGEHVVPAPRNCCPPPEQNWEVLMEHAFEGKAQHAPEGHTEQLVPTGLPPSAVQSAVVFTRVHAVGAQHATWARAPVASTKERTTPRQHDNHDQALQFMGTSCDAAFHPRSPIRTSIAPSYPPPRLWSYHTRGQSLHWRL